VLRTALRLWARNNVIQKGVRGSSTTWLVIGALGLARRFFADRTKKVETVALGERLRPGDELLLRYPGKPGRKTRKEISIVQKTRTKERIAYQENVARLTQKIAKGGWGARSARKELASLKRPS
jgi:hypothetical protein